MTDESLARAVRYYDRFSSVYDVFSSPRYYRKPREAAVKALRLEPGQLVLNVPCGTGQNFPLLQNHLHGTGTVVGVDVSPGMLAKAAAKVRANGWDNIDLIRDDVHALDAEWAASRGVTEMYDAVLCDLGLSGFPSWQRVVDQLVTTLKPGGRLVVMDWFIPHRSLRGASSAGSARARSTATSPAICATGWMTSRWTNRSRAATCSWPRESGPWTYQLSRAT